MVNSALQMSSKPNVLLLLDSFENGGAERQMLVLARLLVSSGRYGVHFACLKRIGPLLKEAEQLSVGEIPEFPLTSFYDWNMLRQLRRFIRFLREQNISVVHTEGFYTNVFGIFGAMLARVPARVGSRVETGGWHSRAKHFVERSAFRLASVVHANSEAVKSVLVRDGVPATRIVVVYYGLEMARVTAPPELTRPEALAMSGLPSDGNRRLVSILANMRLPVKDYPMFLSAARRVCEAVPGTMFALAGEGEMTEQLRDLARTMGLEHNTFFVGRCDHIAELLFASDICALSSKAEGFSNSILEYMGAARPVVATDVGGAREAIVEGETGYLVQSGDDETMAARIITLLRDPERARAMGERGREIVMQKFSCEAQLEATERMYDRLLAKHDGKEMKKRENRKPRTVMAEYASKSRQEDRVTMARKQTTSRRWRRPAIVVICAAALWPFLAWLGATLLIVKRELPAADAIVVLSGPATYLERVNWAARLYRDGRAPIVVVSNEGLLSVWSQAEERNLYFHELSARELQRRGVPNDKIAVVSGIGAGTFQESSRIRDFATERQLKRLLIVTSAYHSRRALWSMRRAAEGSPLEIGITAAPPGLQTPAPATWWLHRWGWQVVAAEYVKLAYYRLHY